MNTYTPERCDGIRMPSTIYPASRKPAQYRALACRCEKCPDEWHHLTFSKDRGYFEPITNQAAEPVLGPVIEWCYRYPDKKDW